MKRSSRSWAPVDALTRQCTNTSSTKYSKTQRLNWSRVSLVVVMVPLPCPLPLMGQGLRMQALQLWQLQQPMPLHLREGRGYRGEMRINLLLLEIGVRLGMK